MNFVNSTTDLTTDSTLLNGLIAWYTFNGDLLDHSGNNNNVIFNSAIPVKGKSGLINTAFKFNGASNYMKVANSKSLNPQKISLYALIKPTGVSLNSYCHGNNILSKEKSENDSGRYFLSFDDAYNWDEIGSLTSKLLERKALKIRLPHSVVYSVGYLAELFSTFSKKPATLNIEKCKDITQLKWVCSNEKAKRELGFKPKYTLEESFKKTIGWYKEMKWI